SGGQFRYPAKYAVTVHERAGVLEAWSKFLFSSRERPEPPRPVPSARIDLRTLDRSRDFIVWFGHSSFLLQLSGRRILTDPIFSGCASPVPFTVRAFAGSDRYSADDMPDLDCLAISHDHWDHLDHETVKALLPRTASVVTTLGTGSHLRAWGCPEEKLTELDWWESADLGGGFRIHAVPSRHFSGRGFTRNRTLWAGFVYDSPRRRIFYSGDGSYGPHFREIGERFPGIGAALMECGQYNVTWPDVHMMPEQTLQAALDLGARALMPVHAGKFVLSTHPWDEPYIRLSAALESLRLNESGADAATTAPRLLTPYIGAPLDLDTADSGENPTRAWWKDLS
ncbi:MAG: MBL fold metallo-hydrolase, partial [Mailhella sp.]|nr:MBL fold metallo-hydrolase [Mailhella sp.]